MSLVVIIAYLVKQVIEQSLDYLQRLEWQFIDLLSQLSLITLIRVFLCLFLVDVAFLLCDSVLGLAADRLVVINHFFFANRMHVILQIYTSFIEFLLELLSTHVQHVHLYGLFTCSELL